MGTPAPWNVGHLKQLRALVGDGLRNAEIGEIMGRSEYAVKLAIHRHAIPVPIRRAAKDCPPPAPVFRDPCPGCGVRLDADPEQCCPRGRALRRLVA